MFHLYDFLKLRWSTKEWPLNVSRQKSPCVPDFSLDILLVCMVSILLIICSLCFFSPLQDMHYCVLDIPWVLWEGNAYIKLIILSFINTGEYVVGFCHDRLLIYDQPQHSYDCGHLSEWNGSAEANLGWLSSPKIM